MIEIKKLEDIATNFRYGKMPDKNKIKLHGNYPIWTGYRNVGFCNEKNIDKNEIVVVARGVGGAGDVKICKQDSFLTNLSIAFRVNENINPLYIYYYFQVKNLRYLDSGSAQSQITINDLKKVKIPVPLKKIQDKIAYILNKFDKKIGLNNQINDSLYEIAEALFSEICSNGKETKLDEIIYDIQSGSRPKGGAIDNGIPSIGAEKIERLGLYDYSNEKYISQEYFSKMKNGIVHSGDVLLYKDGAYTGKISMALNGFPHKKCAINEHVFILRTKNGWANNYLYFLLNHYSVKEQLHAMASSKAAQPGLNQEEVKSVKVIIPEKEIIIEFENKVKHIVEKIIENAKENAILSQLRDTLLPKLMNGEIDLENIEI